MVIKVLGPGCANCRKLEEVTRKALERSGVAAEVVPVHELADIMAYGVMSTPALVIDEQLKLAGRVPSIDEVVRIIEKAQ